MKLNTLYFLFIFLIGCIRTLWGETLHPTGIGKNNNYLNLNGEVFIIKSIYLIPWMPGENPAYGDQPLKADYHEIMTNIKATGANTVSVLHALMPTEFYKQARAHDLKIIQGVWFTQNPSDFQDATFKANVKTDIKNMIDNFHNRNGVDYSEDILFLNIGNEFYDTSITATNNAHPTITAYTGTYISAPSGSNATECFLAEICDYAVTYEVTTYGTYHYVSHSTWPPVSPTLLDTSFLDVISYNIYSYWPDEVKNHTGGSVTGTSYQGYIEEAKSLYPTNPFYISEFGYSTAPLKPDTACVTEQEQATGLKSCWQDITTSSYKIAGAAVYDYMDEWWPQANTASWPSMADEDEHAQDDREEWFGIIKVDGTSSTNYTITKKPSYYSVQEMYGGQASTGTATATSSKFWAYPNPCSKKTNKSITFSNLSGKNSLEIYTIEGQRIFKENITQNKLTWNLLNYYDNEVAVGIYIVKVSGPSGDEFHKIAIVP